MQLTVLIVTKDMLLILVDNVNRTKQISDAKLTMLTITKKMF